MTLRRIIPTVVISLLAAASAPAREADFNRGWKFTKGDPAGAEQLVFDDIEWQSVRTPHDWAIAGPFDPEADGHSAKLPWRGVGWYRKWLMIDSREEGSRVYLDFDGVMAAPRVFVNGELAGTWDYGYTPFRVDITPHVRFGRANVVALRVDTTRMTTRWYPGAGIYRKVTLVVSPPVHLTRDGVCVTTPTVEKSVAEVVVSNECESHLQIKQPVEVAVALVSPDGDYLDQQVKTSTLAPNAMQKIRHEFSLAGPRLWDIKHPTLYTVVSELRVGGRVVDRRETRFGVRTFGFTPDEGFWLNGRRVEIQGVNLHHDLGPLGAAFNRHAAKRQLDTLKDAGVNAIRTAHNPPASELLDLCDQMGFLVWDELFDKWDGTAGRVDGEPSFESHMDRHAASFVRRDRNHPSVVVWSIGNEIINQPYDPEGKSRERISYARQAFLRHDSTRPVALGCFIPETANDHTLADLDVAGWNYQRRYALFRNRFPGTPIVYSESAAAVSTRGWYELPLPSSKCDYSDSHQVNAYELSSAAWADLPEIEFERLRKDRYVAGEFVWTGFDYLGEPTPFGSTARSSYFGFVDLVGLPKDRFYLYRSKWRPDEPTVHLSPHWNWPDRVGEHVPVMVYTNGDSAELFLNGRSLGTRRKRETPVPPHDLAAAAVATATTRHASTRPAHALGGHHTGWRAAAADSHAWFQADLGEVRMLRAIVLEFPQVSQLYGYRLESSVDGRSWDLLTEHVATEEPRWGGVNEAVLNVATRARHVRVAFGPCLRDARPSLTRFSAYGEPYESQYFLPTYDYRLRWNQVTYEPGELRAVTYRDGVKIGESVVRTAGPPARIRLTADRSSLTLDGEDLAYVIIEAIDAAGVVCPLADDLLTIALTGPCELAGADAGDPLSLDPFQDGRVRLFGGKAVAILRATEGEAGVATLRVTAPDLPVATLRFNARLPIDAE